MNEEELKVIYIIDKEKSKSIRILNIFRKAFPDVVERYFKDTVLLKNGITIIAIGNIDFITGKRNYNWYYAEDFMEICYEKAYRNLQNNWNELKSWLEEDNYKVFEEIWVNVQEVLKKMQELEQGKDE